MRMKQVGLTGYYLSAFIIFHLVLCQLLVIQYFSMYIGNALLMPLFTLQMF